MVEGVSKSIAEEAARLCSDVTRVEGVKSEGKYRKRETSAGCNLVRARLLDSTHLTNGISDDLKSK
jgi:hypothetical protein